MKIKLLKSFLCIGLASLLLNSCDKSEGIPVEVEVQDFVWKGMNAFYFWQDQVADLSDSRFSKIGPYVDYLQGFENPADLFQNLRFQPGVEDRFSVIVDDYIALENSFQGINLNNGMEFGLVRFANNPSDVFGYVRYVLPNSDAATQGVVRGMIFTEVDGTQLTDTNFRSLLFGSNTTYTITLADYNNGNPTANSTTITLTKSQIQENPIHVITTLTDGAHKVGYLMYNQFASSYDGQLNDAFAFFQSENITDLIIDLRYNGGGSVASSVFLSGMVTGQFNGQLFARQRWNTKIRNNENINQNIFINNFTNQLTSGGFNEPLNSLNLNRVYFITTGNTASASELIMNGLTPYITVNSVGTTTIGKVHGSITLYDSDNLLRDGPNFNTNHTWALQPLTFDTVNANGTNQPQGIPPTVEFPEDFGNLGVLGDRSDPLLDRTMILITTGSRSSVQTNLFPMEEIASSQNGKLSNNDMFVEMDEQEITKNPILERLNIKDYE